MYEDILEEFESLVDKSNVTELAPFEMERMLECEDYLARHL